MVAALCNVANKDGWMEKVLLGLQLCLQSFPRWQQCSASQVHSAQRSGWLCRVRVLTSTLVNRDCSQVSPSPENSWWQVSDSLLGLFDIFCDCSKLVKFNINTRKCKTSS